MNNSREKTILAFAAVYLVWGSTFLGVSIALKSFPPFLLSAMRFLIGGLALASFCYIRKEKLPSYREILSFAFWGIIIFGGGVIAVVWAQQYLPSSLASIIITTPFWFIVLDKSQWHVNFRSPWIMSGLTAGLIGVILLVSQKPTASFGAVSLEHSRAILVMVCGSVLWVIGSLRLRSFQTETSVFTKTAIHLLAAGVFAISVSFISGEFSALQLHQIRTDSVVAVLFLSILSTTATFMAFIWLVRTQPVSIVSTYSYVNPMVAVLLGVLVGGETMNTLQVMAMVVILSGVLFVNMPKYLLRMKALKSRNIRPAVLS
jgi:drug/metabolite transporter (DMT)-like permease